MPKEYRPHPNLFWVWEKTHEEDERELRPTRPSLFQPYAPKTKGKLMTWQQQIAKQNAQLANEVAEKHPELTYELEEGEIYETPKPLPAYTGPLFHSTTDRSEQSVGEKTVTPRRHTRIRKNH